jgi:nicotinamide mononucleotide (NMN) deamidase PncC
MHIFSGDRHMVRQQAVRTALMMIADALA